MFYHDLDDLPKDRYPEHLILISEKDFNEAKRTKKTAEFLLAEDKHYLVVPSADEAKYHPITHELDTSGLLKANTLLLLDKKEQARRYLPYDMLADKTLYFQMLSFTELCQHLGAKSVDFTSQSASNRQKEMHAEISANLKGATAKTGADYQNHSSDNRYTDQKVKFEGIKNLEKAEELMKTGLFDNNPHIITFYNAARNQENKMLSQKVSFSINQELSKQLGVFVNADIPVLQTIFNAEFKANIKEIQSWKVEYEVEF